jgi:hypothetical protein
LGFAFQIKANAMKIGARRACLCSSEVYMSPTKDTSHPPQFLALALALDRGTPNL